MPSLADILRYGAPIAAQTVGGVLNRRAATNATNSLTNGVTRGMDSLRQGVAQAQNTLRTTYDQQRQDLNPYAHAGDDALNRLKAGVGEGGEFTRPFTSSDFELNKDPGFNWRLQQGQKAIEAQANAGGTRFSGATLKAMNQFAQGEAAQEFSNAYNRWRQGQQDAFDRTSQVAGIGERGTRDLAAAGSDFGHNTAELQRALGEQIAGLQVELGNAKAAGDVAKANSITDTINGILTTVDKVGTAKSMADLLKIGGSVVGPAAATSASLAGGVAVPSMAAVNSTLAGMAANGIGFPAATTAATTGAAATAIPGGAAALAPSAAAPASSGLGASIGAFLTNPITIAAGAALGIGLLWHKSQVHQTADKWVQSAQNDFDRQMASVNEDQSLSPQNKAELQRAIVTDYLAGALTFMNKGGKQAKVIRQAMQTFRTWYPQYASMAVA